MPPRFKSGDVMKLAPGYNNLDLVSVHRLHSDLSKYYGFGAAAVTWKSQEALQLGGDRRLYQIGLPTASATFPAMTQCALEVLLDFVGWNGIDALVTARLWKKNTGYRNYNGILVYDPPEDQKETPRNVDDVVLTFNDLREI